jgi:hypothetical protein
VDRFGGPRKWAFIAIAALAIVLAVSLPSQARGAGGRGFGGGHPGGAVGHGGFDGHHGVDGHHGFDGHHFDHHRFGVAPVFPFYGYYPYYPPAYGYQAPSYWYYCPSAGAYYPYVQSCAEAWEPVPAS